MTLVGARVRRFRLRGEEFVVVSFPLDLAAETPLTAAEREVAALAARGMSNREIAKARKASENTIANQLKSIFKKLGVRSRMDLVRLLG